MVLISLISYHLCKRIHRGFIYHHGPGGCWIGRLPSASLLLFIPRPSDHAERAASLAERLQSWHMGSGGPARSANWQMAKWEDSKGMGETMEMLDNGRTWHCLVLMNNLVCKSTKQEAKETTRAKITENGAEETWESVSSPGAPTFIKGGQRFREARMTSVRPCC